MVQAVLLLQLADTTFQRRYHVHHVAHRATLANLNRARGTLSAGPAHTLNGHFHVDLG